MKRQHPAQATVKAIPYPGPIPTFIVEQESWFKEFFTGIMSWLIGSPRRTPRNQPPELAKMLEHIEIILLRLVLFACFLAKLWAFLTT